MVRRRLKNIDEQLYGSAFFGAYDGAAHTAKLARRFGYPPTSVLNTREKFWIQRKQAWLDLGIVGETGRLDSEDENLGVTYAKSLDGFGGNLRRRYLQKELADKTGIKIKEEPDNTDEQTTGTSVFDPVLTELMYRWFCPIGGKVLDPFAGGSTRGVVAEVLGYRYTGIELRANQVEANKAQAKAVNVKPNWIVGDSYELNQHIKPKQMFDMVFTCPPYYDLEVYTAGIQSDGSCFRTYRPDFFDWYSTIIGRCACHLRDNRFFVLVVGEIRDRNGFYRNFVADTIEAATSAGLRYYNELILITRIGSLPLRVGRAFNAGRKVGKSHQNVLVFYKGDDPKQIKELSFYDTE